MAQLAGNGDTPDSFANNEPANLITGSAYTAAVLPIGDEHVGDTSIQIKDIERACVYTYLVGPARHSPDPTVHAPAASPI